MVSSSVPRTKMEMQDYVGREGPLSAATMWEFFDAVVNQNAYTRVLVQPGIVAATALDSCHPQKGFTLATWALLVQEDELGHEDRSLTLALWRAGANPNQLDAAGRNPAAIALSRLSSSPAPSSHNDFKVLFDLGVDPLAVDQETGLFILSGPMLSQSEKSLGYIYSLITQSLGKVDPGTRKGWISRATGAADKRHAAVLSQAQELILRDEVAHSSVSQPRTRI